MILPLPLLSILLLPLLSAASPTPTSLSPFTREIHASIPIATPPPERRVDVSIPPVSIPPVSIPPISIKPVSIKSISIKPYTRIETCTPGFSAYATPGVNGYVPPEACNALWAYSPNFGAAIAFSILFGVLTLLHIGQATVYRNGFCWVVVTAGLWETGAYVFRALGSKDQQSSGIALVAQILVLVAPVWVNAFAYMVFARMVHFYSPKRKVLYLSPSVLALIFVTLDIISFVVQLVGGGMAGPGSSPESQKKGLDIYMGGIGMQEGFVVLFLGLVIKFHRDQLQAERTGCLSADKIGSWKWLIWALYACLIAITIRIIYRLAEFSAGLGANNPLPSNEPLLYVMESTPMLLALLVWNIVHPGRFIKGPDAKMPRSWLSRHLCCCCHRRRCDECRGKLGHGGPRHHHHSTGEVEMEDHQEMLPVSKKGRVSVAAAPVNPFTDPSSNEEQLRLRPSPDAGYHRDVSPEPSIYSAYRPR